MLQLIFSGKDMLLYAAPTGVPQELNISSVNLTNITIQWDPVECSQRNGEIDGYRLIYYPTTNSNSNQSVLIYGSDNRTFTVVGLQPSINYTLNLEAVNRNYSLFGPDIQETVVTSNPDGTKLFYLMSTLI